VHAEASTPAGAAVAGAGLAGPSAGGDAPLSRRRGTLAGLALGVAVAWAAGSWPGAAVAGEAATAGKTRCEGTRVVVHGGGRADAALVCAGARDAIGFFAEQQLDTAVDVDVEITTQLPQKVAASAVGCYHPERKRVYVLPYADFARRGDWFGVPIEPATYRSLASHEVAHAVAACNFSDEQPSLAAVEYVGYVAMLSVMQPDLRSRVLAQNPGEGYDDDLQINSTVYLMAPTRFAVESYRHYLRPENGTRYLRDVLGGRIRLE
jgi:hypothetical protein